MLENGTSGYSNHGFSKMVKRDHIITSSRYPSVDRNFCDIFGSENTFSHKTETNSKRSLVTDVMQIPLVFITSLTNCFVNIYEK